MDEIIVLIVVILFSVGGFALSYLSKKNKENNKDKDENLK